MRIEEDLKERLLTASRAELESLRSERPELAELIDELLGTEVALGAWLGVGESTPTDAIDSRAPTAPGSGVVSLPWRPPRALVLAAASIAGLFVSAFLLRAALTNSPARAGEDGVASADGPPLIQHDLEVETDSDYMIFPTSDPDIAVVWLMNGD